VVDCCEHGNKPSGSVKGRQFLDYLGDYQLLKEDYTPWSCLIGKTTRRPHFAFVFVAVSNEPAKLDCGDVL
jgi:hypothetical protein